MAADQDALAGALPEKQAGVAHLLDDVGDGDLRAEIVAGDRDADAAGIEARAPLWLNIEGSSDFQ